MIFWSIYLPALVIVFSLYFTFTPTLHKRNNKKAYKIDQTTSLLISANEYWLSLSSIVLFAINGLVLGYLIEHNYTQTIVSGATNYKTVFNGFVGFIAAAILHDFYFYVTHRILHWRPIFRTIHHVHHQSYDTNPWSAFSFHPLEGILHVAGITIIALIVPMSETTLAVFGAYLVLISIYGHSGYELRSHRLRIFGFFNTSYHHFLHHKFVKCNYGIYFNFWDTIFKTNHKEYPQLMKSLSDRITKETMQSPAITHDEPHGKVL
jgi:Delta7-sterol 5-desaturase